MLRTDVKRVFVEGDEAFVRYDLVTNTSVGPVSTVELLKIEDGRVRSIWLLFDQPAWSAAVEESKRRAQTS